MADDYEVLYKRLLANSQKWERLYQEKCEECAELTTINDELHYHLKAEIARLKESFEAEVVALRAENARLQGEVMVAARVRPRREENEALRAALVKAAGLLHEHGCTLCDSELQALGLGQPETIGQGSLPGTGSET